MARGGIIDLRTSLKPQQSPVVTGLEGFLDAFGEGQDKIKKKKDISKYFQDVRGMEKEEADKISELDMDMIKIYLAQDERKLVSQQKKEEKASAREEEIAADAQLMVSRNVPVDRAVEIANIENTSLRGSEMKRELHPSILDSIINNATGYLQGLTTNRFPSTQQQIDPAQQQQVDPAQLQQQQKFDPNQQQEPQQFDPAAQQQEQQQQQPQEAPGLGEQFLTGAGQVATGALTQLAGMPGDFLTALDALKGKPQSTPDLKAKSIKEWEAKREESEPGSFDRRQADRVIKSLKVDPDKQFKEVQEYIPSAEKIREKVVPKLTKGTSLEKFTIPHSNFEKKLQEFGGTTALLARMGANPAGTMINLLKAGGVAVGGDAAGWLAEKVTGSKGVGEVVKNVAYIGYSALPGAPEKLAKAKGAEWAAKVVKPAAAKGKLVNLKSVDKKMNALSAQVGKHFDGHTAQPLLDTEISLIQGLGEKATPQAVQDRLTQMSKSVKDIPEQAQEMFGRIMAPLKEALVGFSNKVSPGAGELLTDAANLTSTANKVAGDAAWVKSLLNYRTGALGGAIWYAGGMKPLIAAGGIGALGKYAGRLLASPAWRRASGELFKAAALRNTALASKILPKLNDTTEKILAKSPKDQQAEIRREIKKARENFKPQS